MRILKRLSICMVVALLMLLETPAYATANNLELNYYPDSQRVSFLESIDLSVLETEPEHMPLRCFDVSDTGDVVIGLNSFPHTICVYNKAGTFLYGFNFMCYGDYAVTWYCGEVMIIFFRGEIAATFDSHGECTDIHIIDASSSNATYIDNVISSPIKYSGDLQYQLISDWPLSPDYSRLEIEDFDGTKTVFYDASSAHNVSSVVSWSILGVLIIIFVFEVIIRIKSSTAREK